MVNQTKEQNNFDSKPESTREVISRRSINFRLINYLTLKDNKRGINLGRI